MRQRYFYFSTVILALAIVATATARDGSQASMSTSDKVARGKYLVQFGSCNDCHTPFKMGPNGPEPDMTRALSGHPSDVAVEPAPVLKEPWTWAGTATNTAFAGPWGVSFTANLTPDKDTGLGSWTEEMFLMALRSGRHEGKGRPILPPMPWRFVGSLSDEDLKAVFAYLQSLPPIRNRVPAPIDPPEETKR